MILHQYCKVFQTSVAIPTLVPFDGSELKNYFNSGGDRARNLLVEPVEKYSASGGIRTPNPLVKPMSNILTGFSARALKRCLSGSDAAETGALRGALEALFPYGGGRLALRAQTNYD